MEDAYRDGGCLQRWRMPTEMEDAYRDGGCLQRWRMPTEMEDAYRDGGCLQRFSLRDFENEDAPSVSATWGPYSVSIVAEACLDMASRNFNSRLMNSFLAIVGWSAAEKGCHPLNLAGGCFLGSRTIMDRRPLLTIALSLSWLQLLVL